MVKCYSFRKSTEQDREQLRTLFNKCFGEMAEREGALTWIKNRYMVAVYDNEIVSCTGILPTDKSEFNGHEITWTCTDIEHRHQGLIVELLQRCEEELEDNLPIYCSCWHLSNQPYANLHNAVTRAGYKKVIDTHVKREVPHSLDCLGCKYTKPDCVCTGDLYCKTRIKGEEQDGELT